MFHDCRTFAGAAILSQFNDIFTLKANFKNPKSVS